MNKHKYRNRPLFAGMIIAFFVILYFTYGIYLRITLQNKYNTAIKEYKDKDYISARDNFQEILDYRDSEKYYENSNSYIELEQEYKKALQYKNDSKYEQSIALFEKLKDYKDSEMQIDEIKDLRYLEAYNQAILHYNQGEYRTAIIEFRVLGEYKENKEYIKECYKKIRLQLASTISAGSMYSVALKENGVVISIGETNGGQTEIEGKDFVSIAAGGFYTIGLHNDGTVDIAGDIKWMKGKPHNEWKNVLQVVSGFDYVAVLFEDGTVDFQGQNSLENYSEILDFSTWKDIAVIDAGYHMVVGLGNDGKIYITGRNATKIMEEIKKEKEKWSDIVSIVTGGTSKSSEGFVAGLKADGTIVTAGKTQYGIKDAEKWSGINKISAGDYHLVGISDDGEIVSVMNDDPSDKRKSKAACCSFLNWPSNINIVDISAGNGITLGLSEEGVIYSSGFDKQGQRPKSGDWTGIKVINSN